MTVKQMLEHCLAAHGFDGLWREECPEWGCGLDNLCSCGGIEEDCQAGYRVQDEDGVWFTQEEQP